RHLPSALNATLSTQPVCPFRERSSWPVCASHTFTSAGSLGPYAEALARRLPSGLKATPPTRPVCRLMERSSWPVCASHTVTAPSPAPARHLPSGLKATLLTRRSWVVRRSGLVFPLRVRGPGLVIASQIFTVPSLLAEARRLPSGLKATL